MAETVEPPPSQGTSDPFPESPTCYCLVLCRDVHIAQLTQNHSLVGIVGWMGMADFPATIAGFMVYARVCNVYGEQDLNIRFESGDGAIWEAGAKLKSREGPLEIHTIMFQFPPTPISKPGRYVLSVYWREECIAQTPIKVYTSAKAEDSQ